MSSAPAAASIALRPVLAAAPRTARLLGAFPAALYLAPETPVAAGPGVVAVLADGAVRLPNALVLAPGVALPRPGPGDRLRVGGDTVSLPGLTLTVGRWWDPRPALPAVAPAALAAGCDHLAGLLAAHPSPVAGAVEGPTGALAERLVGLGPGLTPAGDDLLAGALATLRLLGAGGQADALAAEVAARASRTTALSAALLACAAQGQVAQPAADVLRALAGGRTLEPAVAALLRVGHTSGRDLAAGILLGARLVLGREAS